MANSIIKHWLFSINEAYSNYFVVDRHPAVKFIASAISWIIWAVIIIAFFSLLYFGHYIIWLSIVAILAIIELIYFFAKK